MHRREKFDKAHQSKPYNPILASVFYKCGFIENWGKGTLNITDDCVAYGLPKTTFEYEWTAVKVTFYKANMDVGLNEGVNNLLQLISDYPNSKTPFFSKKLNTAVKNIERWIKSLKDANKIEYIGSPKKGGYYKKDQKVT